MAIDFLARERHFLDHLAPIWHELPAELRGRFYVAREITQHARDRGLDPTDARRLRSGGVTVVSAYRDLKLAREAKRLCVLSEHGAGQSYVGVKSGSYIGAPDRAGCVAVLVPGAKQAAQHREAHPAIPAHVVGVPKLDALHRQMGGRKPRGGRSARTGPGRDPVVAISFHWACRVAPEARGTYMHYKRALRTIPEAFPGAIGHGHPRVMDLLHDRYRRAGFEVVYDFDEVIERADVYVCDNSSTMYEWASLDRPVVVLNAPWYRKTVKHGLRFWEYADLGPQVWKPENLEGAIHTALADPPELAERRREIVKAVYVACDGRAAWRAARALREIDEEWGAP